MATRTKTPIAAKLAAAFASAQPANPALNSADKAFLRGLKKRGFTDMEIIDIAKNAGFVVTHEMLATKAKK